VPRRARVPCVAEPLAIGQTVRRCDRRRAPRAHLDAAAEFLLIEIAYGQQIHAVQRRGKKQPDQNQTHRRAERIGDHATDDLSLPDCVLMFFDRLLAFDHLHHQIHIIATADVSRESPRRAYDRALADIAILEKKLAKNSLGLVPIASDQIVRLNQRHDGIGDELRVVSNRGFNQ